MLAFLFITCDKPLQTFLKQSAGYQFRKKECLNIFHPCYWLLKRPHVKKFIVPSKITAHLKSTEISSLSFVIITKIFLDCTLMALIWGTKWQQRWFMEVLLKVPDSQINPASSEQSYMLFHLHWLPFTIVKRRILLFFSDSMSSLEAISGFKDDMQWFFLVVKVNCSTSVSNIIKSIWILRKIKK